MRFNNRFQQALLYCFVLQESSSAFSVSTPQNGRSTATTTTTVERDAAVAKANELTQALISQKYREISHAIATEFVPTVFKPVPSLSNCHVQTISGVYLRNNNAYKYVPTKTNGWDLILQEGAKAMLSALTEKEDDPNSKNGAQEPNILSINPERKGFYDERQRFETPGGDFFDVDFKYQHTGSIDDSSSGTGTRQPSSKGTVIVLHGLQSNSKSSLSVDMAMAYVNQGFDVACMNFRGCAGEMNRKMGGYHLGFTDDLKQFLTHLKTQRDNNHDSKDSTGKDSSPSPIFLSGFSLGSNVVLKALGELGDSAHRDYHIYGAAVCGAPFDQESNVNFVQAPGFNRLVYMGFLLKSLKKRSLEQMELFRGSEEWKKVDYDKVVNAETIADIENAVLAPIYGFQDNIDYYRKNSCLQFLDAITVPTLIINAADDPFFDPSIFPWDKSSDRDSASPVRMVRTKNGGHLGFMFHQEETDDNDSSKTTATISSASTKERPSWMPSELARFLQCAFDNKEQLDKIKTALGEVEGVVSMR